jgi:hypothetical protein
MGMEGCLQLLAGIRSVDGPVMANGLRQQKANLIFHAVYQLGMLYLLGPTTRKFYALVLTAHCNA